jgi:hypothetical protein
LRSPKGIVQATFYDAVFALIWRTLPKPQQSLRVWLGKLGEIALKSFAILLWPGGRRQFGVHCKSETRGAPEHIDALVRRTMAQELVRTVK